MNTIINKIIFGIAFLALSWFGLGGLIENIQFQNIQPLDVSTIEEMQEIDFSAVEISNGIAHKNFIYYEIDLLSNIDIVYPLISVEQSEKIADSVVTSVRLLVKLNGQSRDCLSSRNCHLTINKPLKGILQTEFTQQELIDFQNLNTDFIKLADNFVLLELQEELIDWYWNLIMFLVGFLFGYTILKSFFRKASSLSDYWNKITEKDES